MTVKRPSFGHSKDSKRRPKAVVGTTLLECEFRSKPLNQQNCDHRNAEQRQQKPHVTNAKTNSRGMRSPRGGAVNLLDCRRFSQRTAPSTDGAISSPMIWLAIRGALPLAMRCRH